MPDSYSQVLIHATFHTKQNGVTINADDMPRLFEYLGGIVRQQHSVALAIGGMPDHIHILFCLPRTITIADFMMYLKKGSSKWLKTIDERYRLFEWQSGYGAFSVSYQNRQRVVNYIANQSEHHRKMTFREEVMKMYHDAGIDFDENYIII